MSPLGYLDRLLGSAQHPKVFSRISLLIPVYNEEKSLPALLKTLAAVDWPLPTEWIFVDDCSTDHSVALLIEAQEKYPQIRLQRKSRNEGKSAAIRTALEFSQGDILIIQDADLEYYPPDLLPMIQPILENRADVVYGSRFRGGNQIHRTVHFYINSLLTFFSNLASGIRVSDMETCYKVFRSDILKSFRLTANRFGFEPEITAYVAKFSLRLLEFPITYVPRTRALGKKISWKDGLAAFWFIFKCNFLISRRRCLIGKARAQYQIRKDWPFLF